MSDIIHLLPESIANQIAAGEVIQRPASVVKELVENSIDADATCIQVNIKDAGRTMIQVLDDGKGMSETDARMAFERHATSKILNADDLFSLKTMGFRGEALASIAAVAQVELRTRQKESDVGTKLSIAGSTLTDIEPDACAGGSILTVKNLFFNVPARRKFLKSNETEFRNIVHEFERVALVNPSVELFLFHNELEIFHLPKAGIRQRILDVFGKTLNQQLLSIEVDSSLVLISGLVARPDTAKKRGALQYFFVNGRFMKHSYFHKAVMQAYEDLIQIGEMPNYFIYFTVDPQTIDVNIHPTKTEIKFENERPIWQILVSAIREALAKASVIPMIDFDKQDAIDIPIYNEKQKNSRLTPPAVQVDNDYNPFNPSSTYSSSNRSIEKTAFDWAKLYDDFEKNRSEIDQEMENSKAENDMTEKIPFYNEDIGEDLKQNENSCYQYKERFIITSLKSGIVIIDQHRAHLRILYEQYLDRLNGKKGIGQKMLFPEIVELTTSEVSVYKEVMTDLQYLGFDLSDLGNNSYAINALPAEVGGVGPAELIKDLLNQAMDNRNSVKCNLNHFLALSLGKVAAINYGKTLAIEEMDHLIAALFSCRESRLTPEGKIILSIINDEELEKRFK
ncbi:MAG: DNA mismatch repair endonuclease MutL [Massilibacteroides sp.]|nr:DNA mismatch repair endonuclease MutL [Massilibacteroides sp.]MDD3062350.1 DNA mismatch repair endonuclease MutL [Massilibacteroides sp.]MDD4114476.1 DNA mismatch repair endonuclease MutL [Massilibacteroides sp.]MDD4660755.1 DNA mismatch repair endonuclease MutL [Massilibacteroides sp.]